jgi:hypothetical protein
MRAFWIKFVDGSEACCEGQGPFDAKVIAEHVSGKLVAPAVAEPNKWRIEDYSVQSLPYPAHPVIWQLDHPVNGKTPTFCHDPTRCAGKTACPQSYSCTE